MARAAFLTAEWRYLAMLNYRVDPETLGALVPAGTEIDRWGGNAYLSLIGFHFRETRVFGWQIPFHNTFEASAFLADGSTVTVSSPTQLRDIR